MKKTGNHSPFIPEGWNTVTPRIVVPDAKGLVEFLKRVFHATGEYQKDSPSVIQIGDSKLMISDAGIRSTSTATLYVYVANADEAYSRALQAGASSIEELSDMPYGDRRGMVTDPWGNIWQIATYRGKSG